MRREEIDMSSTNKKNTRKINVIDVIVILLVLALIATAVYKVYSEISNNPSNKQSNYVLTFECDSEYRGIIEYLKSGDAVYFSTNGPLLGYLYDASGDGVDAVYEIEVTGEAESESEAETRRADNDPYTKVAIGGMIMLASNAVKAKNSGYYTIEERNISEGSTLEVYTEKAVFTLTVKSIGTEAQ